MKKQLFKLGKSSLIYGIGTMIRRFISLLLLPLFTSYLTPTDYGVISLLALLPLVAQPIFCLGLGAAMGPCYFEGNNLKRKSQTVWTTFLLLLCSVTVLSIIAMMFPHQLSNLVLQSPQYGQLVSMTLITCAISTLATPFTQRIQFEERAKTYVVLSLSFSLLSIFMNIVAVVFLGLGVFGLVISQLIMSIINCISFMIAGSRGTTFLFSKAIVRELLRLGIPFVPSFAFLFILMQSNRYILQYFYGLEQVGIYSIGFNIGTVLNLVVGAITTAWYPFFMSYMEKPKEVEILFGRIFTYYTYLVGTLCMLFFIGAKFVISVMTQPAFHQAHLIVGFAASVHFFIGIFSMLLPGMYYTKEIKFISLIQGTAAAFSLGINIILVKTYGLLGAGIALALGHVLIVVFQYLWNVYRKNKYPKIQYEWSRLIVFLVLFVFIVTTSMLISTRANLVIESCYVFIVLNVMAVTLYLTLRKNEIAFIKDKLAFFAAKKVKRDSQQIIINDSN